MIQSFGDAATEALFHGASSSKVRGLPTDLCRVAIRKLDMLNAAAQLKDLRSPPGNRLEALKGSGTGQHSIRVNDQWRIVFRWSDAGPEGVTMTDYH